MIYKSGILCYHYQIKDISDRRGYDVVICHGDFCILRCTAAVHRRMQSPADA